jgi:formate hydrogenlyase transcriptional activator
LLIEFALGAHPGASDAAAGRQDRDDIARIVKETLNALDGKKSVDYKQSRNQREEIVRALTECKGLIGGEDGAAEQLGINRTTLLSRMKKLGIYPRQFS